MFVYVYVYVCVCMYENVFERVYVRKRGGVEDRRVTAPQNVYLLVPFDFWTQSQFF